MKLSHIDKLESESIHIIREVASEFDNPVMLYSIGKDSSVMLHLAQKAFYPSKIPFKLMHIDTTWKFKEMISFRDNTFKKLGYKLLIFSNKEGIKNNVNPIDYNSDIYTDIMKTQALRQALQKYNNSVDLIGFHGQTIFHNPQKKLTNKPIPHESEHN